MRVLSTAEACGQCVPVARILQQHPQPRDLHSVLARISAGIQKDAVRWYPRTSLTVDLIPLPRARDPMREICVKSVHIRSLPAFFLSVV